MGKQQVEESWARERLVKEYGLNQGDIDLIKELQDPKKGNLRLRKDQATGVDVINCRYLGHEWESRTDENGRPFILMDGERQDHDPKITYFQDKLGKYAAFLKEQEHIPVRAIKRLTDEHGSAKGVLSADKGESAMKAIDDFLSRSSQ